MAYGVKYRMTFKDNEGIAWIADIYQENFTDPVTPIIGWTFSPVILDLPSADDPYEPVCHTSCVVNIASTVNDEFIEFATADLYEYYVDLQRAGSTYWKGLLITEPYEEDYTSAPYGVSLTFSDGLAELQFERYDSSGTLRSTMATNIAILVNCIGELPSVMARSFREMINVFEDNMNDADTEGLLEQLYIYEPSFWELDSSDDEIKGINCLDVIKHIIFSLGCRIVTSQDKWYIQRIQEMKATTAIKHVDYNSSGAVTGNSTLDLRQAKSAKSASMPTLLIPLNNDARNTFNREYQEIQFEYTSKNITTLNNNLHINWDFSKGYDLENSAPVPKHYVRSSAVNTQLGVDNSGIHLSSIAKDLGVVQDLIGDQIVLVIEDSMLLKTEITSGETTIGDVLQVDATRESFNLLPASPADNTVTAKNLLTDTDDHIEIRIKGWFDYTLTSANFVGIGGIQMMNKWTVQLGSNYYNTSNQTWSGLATSRTWDREWADSAADPWLNQNGVIKRHHFDKIITLKNFPADSIDDLTVTWFIPGTVRAPSDNYNTNLVTRIDITFEAMQIRYISNNSTEFSVQKVLGATGATDLHTNRKVVKVKHGDGPSNFSVNSFRIPTTFLATTLWSTRGNSESLPGYKMLIIDAYFESFGTYRQVWNGTMYGFLEFHNTVSNLESKVWLQKAHSFDVKNVSHGLSLHELAALSPSIGYTPQIDLSGFTNPVDSGDGDIGNVESGLDDSTQTNQGSGTINTTDISVSTTQVIKTNNDSTGTAGNYPK